LLSRPWDLASGRVFLIAGGLFFSSAENDREKKAPQAFRSFTLHCGFAQRRLPRGSGIFTAAF